MAEYWAAQSADAIGQEVMARIEAYYDYARSSPVFERIRRAHRAYYGLSDRGETSYKTLRDGVQGELVRMRANHYRNLAQLRLTLATQQKPSWQPVATNSDHASLAMATTVTGLMDYYWREKRVERVLKQAIEDIQWSGESTIHVSWDAKAGNPVAANPETGEVITDGDLAFANLTPLDLIRDPLAEAYEHTEWRAARLWTSRWNLAGRYPERADDVLAMERDATGMDRTRQGLSRMETDEIAVYHWYHDKTPALPDGRYVILTSADVVLFDGPLPYRSSPVVRMVEAEWRGSPFGYTAMWDCLGPQEVVDALTAAIVTQQTTHAVRKIVGVKGSGLNYRQLSQGLAYIEVASMDQRPVPLDFSEVSPQIFQFRTQLVQEMQMFSAVNDVVRGVVNPSLKSGAHAALYDATALRAANGIQEAFYRGAEDVGTFVLHALTDYAADSERTARIVGESKRSMLLTFTGKDLGAFDRVIIESSNAATKTTSGKLAVADALLEKGALGQGEIAGQRYLTLVKTGELSQLSEAREANVLRLKRDKELLAKGQMPVIIAADTHWLDIPEYLSVLASPEAREQPEVVSVVLEAVRQKLEMWRTMPPDLLMVMGGPPAPSNTMPPGPPGGPPSATPMPESGPSSGTPPPGPPPGPPPTDVPAGMPSLPRNPSTGEEYDTAGAMTA